jgi:hypothetical protein
MSQRHVEWYIYQFALSFACYTIVSPHCQGFISDPYHKGAVQKWGLNLRLGDSMSSLKILAFITRMLSAVGEQNHP